MCSISNVLIPLKDKGAALARGCLRELAIEWVASNAISHPCMPKSLRVIQWPCITILRQRKQRSTRKDQAVFLPIGYAVTALNLTSEIALYLFFGYKSGCLLATCALKFAVSVDKSSLFKSHWVPLSTSNMKSKQLTVTDHSKLTKVAKKCAVD